MPSTSFYRRKWTKGKQVGSAAELETATVETATRDVSKWAERHTKRRAACEALRRAAWYVRRHWGREGDTWTSGPCQGMAVVDPVVLFAELDGCCQSAAIRPTTGGAHGNVAVFARRCKRYKCCAVCAAAESQARARRVLVVAARDGREGALVHLVLTHRDRPPKQETNEHAWMRWEGAWQRLRTGKHGRWLAETVLGFQANLETTGGATGWSWHPHAHFVVELRPGVALAPWRDELARRWTRGTALAALEAGYGVDAYVDELGARRAQARAWGESLREARELALRALEPAIGWNRAAGWSDGRERWCEAVDERRVRDAVYQATKYATPHFDQEDPSRVAEWVQWAIGRRLVRWGGEWARPDVQEWIDAQIELDDERLRVERVEAGDAPDVGKLLRGAQPTVDLAELERRRAEGLTTIVFDRLDCQRRIEAVDELREWWSMLGEQRMALRAARSALEGPDDPRASMLAELSGLLRLVRRMPVVDGLRTWSRIRAELERSGPFG